MADPSDIHLLKRTKISVLVDEALPDILVVTYEHGVQIFKGVLLDSTKKNIPCGIPNINPAFNATTKAEDPLYSVNQRFAYTDPANAQKKKNVLPAKYRNNKMTVRLRARQVVCSKCKGICNENSENVTRKRKSSETILTPPMKRSANAPLTRAANTELKKKTELNKRTLIPQELPNALSGNVNKINIDNNKKPLTTVSNITCDIKTSPDPLEQHSDPTPKTPPDPKLKRVLRNKKTSEEIWEDTETEDTSKTNNQNSEQPLSSNTRTIKICYGPQGEGTVLKIPAQIENLSNVEDDLEENINVEELKEKETNKAARKAMKKAKKEAKKKTIVSSPDNTSPRYSVGGSSPRYTVGSASPRHGLGNHSPRYIATLEPNTPKKRKHKMKHKKKHREDKDRKHNKEGEGSVQQEEVTVAKEACVTQKLSINLKRLSTSYTSCSTDKTDEYSSDEFPDIPDLAPTSPPLQLRLNSQAISHAPGCEGRVMMVGDVVWGKMRGFSWWPARILTLSACDIKEPEAYVAWYGFKTACSRLPCNQLCTYLDNFKIIYNKKIRGRYKDAIKEATNEARALAEVGISESIVSSPARIIPPALASPSEINVIS